MGKRRLSGRKVNEKRRRAWIVISSDASFEPGNSGWGIVARWQGGKIIESGLIPDYIGNATEAELYSIAIGIAMALDKWPEAIGITVECDCIGALDWASGIVRGDKIAALAIHKTIKEHTRNVSIDFKWIKGHSQDDSLSSKNNRICDRLARKARKEMQE